ncbi:MAG: acyl-[Lachnospiraceae bacterium]|nr:acyl-[acyl-carrier-protein] thioesterase [Lachnospiraceae bacterium]
MYFFDGRIRYSEVDSEGKLTLSSLIDYFQDCSSFQSEDLEVGLRFLADKHKIWVLNSWQIVVDRFPRLGEQVRTGTQPYEFKGFLGLRNFAMFSADGAYVAKANSVWSLLDTDTWKPVAMLPEFLERYAIGEQLDMEYAPRKITIPEGGSDREGIVIRRQHLDTNHHVNNGQYVNIAMDFLPEGFVVGQVRAEYKRQTFLDDVLIPYVVSSDGYVLVALKDTEDRPHAVIEFTERTTL